MLMNETMNNNKSNDYCPQALYKTPAESDANIPSNTYLLPTDELRDKYVAPDLPRAEIRSNFVT